MSSDGIFDEVQYPQMARHGLTPAPLSALTSYPVSFAL